jgi:hypothetical protein
VYKMEVIVSSKLLFNTLDSLKDLQLMYYKVYDGKISFGYEDDEWHVSCETRFGLDKWLEFDRSQWRRLRLIIKFMPEQPLHLKFDEYHWINFSGVV